MSMAPDGAASVNQAIELHHLAGDSIMKGDYSGYATLYSHADDVTLGNPFGPFVRGYEAVLQTLEGAASHYRDGGATGFDGISQHVSGGLACIVEVERYRARVGGREEMSDVSARVTSVFRREDGVWRLIHRHADPITSARPAESVIQP
jgi:ketosteroid isomerase-like protein